MCRLFGSASHCLQLVDALLFFMSPLLRAFAHWIPIEDTLSATVRLLRGGHVQATFEADGLNGDTLDAAIVARCHTGINTVLRNLRDSRLVLKVVLVRTQADPATWPHQRCTIPFIEDVLHAYRDRLLDRRLYENRLFITLEYRAAATSAGGPRAEQTIQERLDLLERACTLLQTSLGTAHHRHTKFLPCRQHWSSETPPSVAGSPSSPGWWKVRGRSTPHGRPRRWRLAMARSCSPPRIGGGTSAIS